MADGPYQKEGPDYSGLREGRNGGVTLVREPHSPRLAEDGQSCTIGWINTVQASARAGETARQIAGRISAQLEMLVPWTGIVAQNHALFVDGKSLPLDKLPKLGDQPLRRDAMIRYSYAEVSSEPCVVPVSSGLTPDQAMEAEVGEGDNKRTVGLVAKGSVSGETAISLVLGVARGPIEAEINVGFLAKVQGDITVDDDPSTPTFVTGAGDVLFFVESSVSSELSIVEMGARVKAEYSFGNEVWQLSLDSYYTKEWTHYETKDYDKKTGKHVSTQKGESALEVSDLGVEYDSKTGKSFVRMTLTASSMLQEDIHLHPLLAVRFVARAAGTIQLGVLVDGDFRSIMTKDNLENMKVTPQLMLPKRDTVRLDQLKTVIGMLKAQGLQ